MITPIIKHIGYNVDPYGQSFFPKSITSAWNRLAILYNYCLACLGLPRLDIRCYPYI